MWTSKTPEEAMHPWQEEYINYGVLYWIQSTHASATGKAQKQKQHRTAYK